MTLNALALEMMKAHHEDSADTNYVAVVEQWIRDALAELALVTSWRAFVLNGTLNTSNSTRVYTLPVDVRDIKLIRNPATEQTLIYKTKEFLAEYGFDLEEVGKPDFWYFEDKDVTVPADVKYKIGFYPVPDGDYAFDVQYDVNPATIASGSHLPIQSDMITVLKYCVRSYMYLDDNNLAMADAYYQRFRGNARLLVGRENRKSSEFTRLLPTDLPHRSDRRFARLDPNHF